MTLEFWPLHTNADKVFRHRGAVEIFGLTGKKARKAAQKVT